jgi:serine/threonine protein kinase
VWAFGCVLYEMLTGRVAFAGDTLSDTIAAILEREPEWAALPAATPAPIRRLLGRCLDKNVKRRLRDIGDVRAEIDDVLSGAAERVPSETVLLASSKRRWLPLAASLTVALVAAAGWAIDRSSRASEPYEHPLQVPGNGQLLLGTNPHEGGIALSPDGATVAMVAVVDGETTPRI